MKACIMCGGTGTRLRPLTFDRPKPTIPILNKPSIVHLVDHLASEGFNDIVITVGYLGNSIEESLGDGRTYGVHIDYVYDHSKLGTAGSVKNAEEILKDEAFIVLGGDHVLDLDLRELCRFHRQNSAIVTIGLLPIDDPREYGIADIDVNLRIHRFLEKPEPGEIFSNLTSTGIYVCSPRIFDWIPENKKYDFAKDLFPDLLRNNERINGFLVRGKWTDIGNPVAYRQAVRWKLDSLPGTRIAGNFNAIEARINGPFIIEDKVSLGSNSAVVGPVMIGENTVIGNRVLIGPYTSIGSNCVIKDKARILSAYLFKDVQIGYNTCISGSIIDNNTTIGKNCILESGSVIGPRVVIRDNVIVQSGVKIWPEVIIEEGSLVDEDILNEKYETETSGS
ncbi:MAG: sugar phosphate nucleotidyltransferase [Methanosarcinales archaeon]